MKKYRDSKKSKKRIMLITPMLHQGGYERMCVLTARLLGDLYDVYLVVFSSKDAFYDVSGLHLIDLELGAVQGKPGKAVNVLRRARRLKHLKRELCIDISYSFGTTANLANVLSKDRDITWAGIRGYNALSDRGAKLIFRKADCVVSCTKTMEADINRIFGTKRSVTLYNPCNIEEIRECSQKELDEKTKKSLRDFLDRGGPLVISMGREDDLKGFWHLIKSFSILKKELPDAKLMIIGSGSYAEYQQLADDLEISEAVCFAGVFQNPFVLLARADVYVLTSQSEGFPNALIEAMACGVPCISVNCKTGPAEILQKDYMACNDQHRVYHADYGILTPVFQGGKDLCAESFAAEEEIFAQEMKRMLTDDELRRHYREAAADRASVFSADAYISNMKKMIEEECNN